MEKGPDISRRNMLKGIVAAAGMAALPNDKARASEPQENLKFEQDEISRITKELEDAQKNQKHDLQQKLLKELEDHLKKAIELTKTIS